jgi:hypothetical protein
MAKNPTARVLDHIRW